MLSKVGRRSCTVCHSPAGSRERTSAPLRSTSIADGRGNGPAQTCSVLMTGSSANADVLGIGMPRSMA